MSRRTLRKPTRWTPEEWSQVERAAADRGVPPLRYVREAALGYPPTPQPGRGQPLAPARRARSLWNQLARVINNLHQLRRVAEVDGDDDGVRVLTAAAGSVEYVISAAPAMLGARGDEVITDVVEAGNALNALAHRANTAEELRPTRREGAELRLRPRSARELPRRPRPGRKIELMPENLADAVAMIDRKIGRDEPVGPPADEVAAMRDEIARLREELQAAKAA